MNREATGLAELLLFGIEEGGDRRRVPAPGRGVAARVSGLLDATPDLRERMGREARRAWTDARGDVMDFLQRTAESRAAIVVAAELNATVAASPGAASGADDELARYLAEVEGMS